MTLLSYVFFYVVAAVLIFQGTHAVGEQREPLGVVPSEVTQEPGKARLRGYILAAFGYLSVALGLLGHGYAPLRKLLPGLMVVNLGLIGVYGLYVIFFSRKVIYQAAPSACHDHPSH